MPSNNLSAQLTSTSYDADGHTVQVVRPGDPTTGYAAGRRGSGPAMTLSGQLVSQTDALNACDDLLRTTCWDG